MLFNKSFPINLINRPIGVTTAKKIIPIINGEIIEPKKIPNLNHNLFRGDKIFEFIKPSNKKNREIMKGIILICCGSPRKDHNDITKKTVKKTNPKLLLELSSILGLLFTC